MATTNNWSNVVIEGDSISIFKRLRSDAGDYSTIVAHLVVARDHLHHNPSLTVRYVGRDVNRVVHNLGYWVHSCSGHFTFDLDVSKCIETLVIDDVIYCC
ncbi:hypothetical protein V6N11_012355 [Hibiscus sabdariffa]|uniref:RNase H type-1 domain-containing protein n=1 Tax=Hibiscus sabdariffa TaxID=183260 RepID=A0ABR2QAY9_9ROSI